MSTVHDVHGGGEINFPETLGKPQPLRFNVHRHPDDPWLNTYAQALVEHREIRHSITLTEPQPGDCPRCWGGPHRYGHVPPRWDNHGGGENGPDGPPIGHHAYVLRMREEERLDSAGTWRIEDHYDVPEPTNYDRLVTLLRDPTTLLTAAQAANLESGVRTAFGRYEWMTGGRR